MLWRQRKPGHARRHRGNRLSSLTPPAVIVSGLIDGLNPCAFGVLLSFVAVLLAGVALGGAYVGGMFLTYLLLGAGLITVVSFFAQTHLPVRIMGVVVVVLGLWMLKDVLLPEAGPALAMPARFHGVVRRALAQTTPIGLFIAGGLVGLCTVPCSGAIYLGVLALIAREPLGTRLGYLLLYNVMFVVPLLAVLAAVANRRTLNRLAHWYVPRKGMAKAAVGLLTVALGFIILVTA